MMDTRRIGSLQVTVVGLGCNNFGRRIDAAGTAEVVEAALDAGINFFDTADVYGAGQSEEFLGRALGARRQEVHIATKFGHSMAGRPGGARPAYVREAVAGSLRRLGTDYIDLYQLHGPDPETPIADTLGALNELVQAGKVREIGCSNFTAEQLREAARAVSGDAAHFVSVQNRYHLLDREPETGVLEFCAGEDMAFLPWFPLASGLLTGKYRQGQPVPAGARLSPDGRLAHLLAEGNLAKVEALIAFAESHGHSILELAVSWLLSRPVVASVIAGATRPDQVRSNAGAAGWRLTPEALAEIDAIASPPAAAHPVR